METPKQDCGYNPLISDCANCHEVNKCQTSLKWFSRIPHFIIDDHLMQLSPSAVKVFLYINRKANFDQDSKYFGKCWLTLQAIEKVTGVAFSNMRIYLKELAVLNLIEYIVHRSKNTKGEFETIHEFEITHYKIMKELDIKIEANKKPIRNLDKSD